MTTWSIEAISGWGRYPILQGECAHPETRDQLECILQEGDPDRALIGYGRGRSYGDAALLRDGGIVITRALDRVIDFDPETGWVHVEAGVTIEQLIERFLPLGFFPPVVPGTQYVSVAGALANNIHGKNHHVDGCFGDHVRAVTMLTASGERVVCDLEREPDLFWATVGGLGLTGLILSMELRLVPVHNGLFEVETIRVEDLDHFFDIIMLIVPPLPTG